MKELLILVSYLLTTLIKLIQPGGTKALVAESLPLKHQLLILNRGKQRSPRLNFQDRLIFSMGADLISPSRISKVAVVVKPVTLLRFHKALVKRKYRNLIGITFRRKPGPKGPPPELIGAIIALKQKNPRICSGN